MIGVWSGVPRAERDREAVSVHPDNARETRTTPKYFRPDKRFTISVDISTVELNLLIPKGCHGDSSLPDEAILGADSPPTQFIGFTILGKVCLTDYSECPPGSLNGDLELS